MKSLFCFLLYLFSLFPGYCLVLLESSFEGKEKENEIIISTSEDLRLEGGILYPWACSLFLDILPPETTDNLSSHGIVTPQTEWGASLATDHLSLGRLILSGAYDRLESRSFPSLYNWEKGPRLTLEKKTSFKGRWGVAFHDRNKHLISHYLDYPDYTQTGLFYNLGDDFLGMEGGILYTRLAGDTESDNSWYDQKRVIQKEDLIHLQGTLKFGLNRQESSWEMRGEGAALLPLLSNKAARIMISLAYEKGGNSLSLLTGFHLGSWLSCAGEETDWNRGFALNTILFDDRYLGIGGELLLWIPREGNLLSYEGEVSLKNDRVKIFGRTDYDSLESFTCYEGGGHIFWTGIRGSLKGEGSWFSGKTRQQTLKVTGELKIHDHILWSSVHLLQESHGESWTDSLEGEGELGFIIRPSIHWEGEGAIKIIGNRENPEDRTWEFSGGIRGKY